MCRSYSIRLIGIFLGISISHLVTGQQLSIQAQLDRPEIKTGEQAVVNVIIRTPDIAKTKFYLQEDPQAGEPYVVVSFLPYDTIDIKGSLQEISARMVITSFDSTLVTIPPIIAETPTEQASTQPMALNVIQPEVDAGHPEHFKPSKEVWEISVTWLDWLYWAITHPVVWGILLLGIILYAYRYYKRHRHISSEPEPQMMIEEISALQRAIDALKIVKSYPLLTQADFKVYYTQIVKIIKDYIDEKRGWHTQKMTSRELLDALTHDSPILSPMLATLLIDADMSKFAKAELDISDAHDALEKALNFVTKAEDNWSNKLGAEQESNSI